MSATRPPTGRSAVYAGTVSHRRHSPVAHALSSRLAMAAVDLDELAPGGRLEALLTRRRLAPIRLARRDYLAPHHLDLAEAARLVAAGATGRRPSGPVVLLTQLRTLGWNFNPISLYYFLDPTGCRLEAVAFEVTSTPWGERHTYVVEPGPGEAAVEGTHLDKALHVSPFLGMDLEYRFSCSPPGERLSAGFEVRRGGELVLEADLRLERRRDLDRRGLAWMGLAYPLMPQRVSARIYLEAARLLTKGAPVHAHPARRHAGTAGSARRRRRAGDRGER